METDSNRLSNILKDIELLCLENNSQISIEQKMQTHTKTNILLEEANEIINRLESNIKNLENNSCTLKLNNNNINQMIELLSTDMLNYDETINIVGNLLNESNNLPVTAQVIDNINQEVIYEEFNV